MDDLLSWLRGQITEERERAARHLLAHTAILALHTPRRENDGDLVCTVCVYFGTDEDQGGNRVRWREYDDWPCDTVRAIALAYQHCPGYREEWRP